MNWLQNSTLVSITIGIFALVACKKGDELSSEIRPRETDLSSNYDSSIAITTEVVNFNSIPTNASFRLLVGRHQDPVFGNVTANAYLRFVNGTNKTTFGPNPVADAISLQFYMVKTVVIKDKPVALQPYIFGSSSKPVSFKVYKLDSAIDNQKLYYRNDLISYNPDNLLAEVVLDNSLINSTITNRIISIPLPSTLGQNFIDNQSSFGSIDSFQNFFKGIALVADAGNEGIIGIYDIQMVLLYHNYYGLNNLYSAEAEIMGASYVSTPTAAQNQFLVDRFSGELGMLGTVNNSSVPTEKCYIQSNTGVFTRVQFSDINSFKEEVKIKYQANKILVNKAELVIKPDSASSYLLPLQLSAFETSADGNVKTTSNGSFQYLQNELAQGGGIFGSLSPLVASYSLNLNEYRFTITTYIQAILDGRKENNGLLVGAENELIENLAFGSLNRFTFYNNPEKFKTGEVKSKIELRVYYTPYK